MARLGSLSSLPFPMVVSEQGLREVEQLSVKRDETSLLRTVGPRPWSSPVSALVLLLWKVEEAEWED
ncbi:hypothetical protein AAFF_G00417590 [Aldrovandia affinis]|uniref:Uncharacterized protein n=1 Tax=Aldrovandia affinis TaxID=143900 RepID=A0AAD7SA62_9TELE|nr:hypothetical protein AAFF_G00417590 [Aldrovandia affinis]